MMLRNAVALCVLLAASSSPALAYLSMGSGVSLGLRGRFVVPDRNHQRPSVCSLAMRKPRAGAFGKQGDASDDQDESANGGDGPVVKKFGKLANVSRQKRGDIVGIRGSTKVQGKKWENLVAKPPTIRVTGGTAKGRKLSRPDVYLRPMMGKVKEALFSILREFDVLREEAVALDTFAGCGSVGIEALSQGIGDLMLSLMRPSFCFRQGHFLPLQVRTRAFETDKTITTSVPVLRCDPVHTLTGYQAKLSSSTTARRLAGASNRIWSTAGSRAGGSS
mmetsp:Transcript_1899/g.4272  ORF Transcript_1899/g.4272 Transcript_1899/m.4272 type:complete len:277 (-) Transcript_1899:567-1397(-)